MAIPVVLFLGNPGTEYAPTRHNLGWWVADLVAQEARIGFRSGRGRYDLAQGRVGGQMALLVKPTAYMNASGEVLDELAVTFEVDWPSLLVVADDTDLSLGQIRVRAGGSSGGHNGLASVIEHAGTDQFARVRCGIGPAPEGGDAADFVLDPFEPDELIVVREMAAKAAGAVAMVLARGIIAAANEFNRRPPAPEQSLEGPAGAE